ncbi:cupin domain-containing protein [Brumimicrobium mesophilum]|uniref:cupin domain-containing protein n=1 Tax=Brumimicrobium mesophilum TaxID=392717 RepID=UPI000D13EE2D|nr:cupin domain-containing protein [Brumimicrobium mesophilum]
MKSKVEKLVETLNLSPHPEGGFYRETYRSSGNVSESSLGSKYQGERSYSTCIYFLLTSDNFSAFHKIKQDEIWHHYDGSPIKLHMISAQGEYSVQIIGKDIENGQLPQYVVEGGCWFGSEVLNENDYSLTGCTVSPGFSFEDFELFSRKELIALYPQFDKEITHLTHF